MVGLEGYLLHHLVSSHVPCSSSGPAGYLGVFWSPGVCPSASLVTLVGLQPFPSFSVLLLLRQGVDQGAPLALSHPRDCDKREEVGSRALAVCEVPRHDHRYRCRQGLPVSSQSREVLYGSGEILFHAISPSSALAGDSRSLGIAGAVGSSRSSSDALLAVASEDALVPRVRPSLASGGFAGGSETGPVLVDGEGSPVSGGSIRDTCAGSAPVFGRVLAGWGAHLLDQDVSGVWSAQEKLLHINLLEMKALFLGLQAFQEDVAGHHVTAMCDNSTVVAYVNKQGGTVSRSLCLLTSRLLRWT